MILTGVLFLRMKARALQKICSELHLDYVCFDISNHLQRCFSIANKSGNLDINQQIDRLNECLTRTVQEFCLRTMSPQKIRQDANSLMAKKYRVTCRLLHFHYMQALWTPFCCSDTLHCSRDYMFRLFVDTVGKQLSSQPLAKLVFSGTAPCMSLSMYNLRQLNVQPFEMYREAFCFWEPFMFHKKNQNELQQLWPLYRGPKKLIRYVKESETCDEVSFKTITQYWATFLGKKFTRALDLLPSEARKVIPDLPYCIEKVVLLALVPELFGGSRENQYSIFTETSLPSYFDFLCITGFLRLHRACDSEAVENPYPVLACAMAAMLPQHSVGDPSQMHCMIRYY